MFAIFRKNNHFDLEPWKSVAINNMDTIYEESQSEMNAKKKAKAIEVIEVEFENVIYADNDRIVRKYFQVRIYIYL